MIGDTIMDGVLNGVVPEANGNRHPDMAPHGVYPCRDGEWLSIAVPDDATWQALAEAIGSAGLRDDSRFSTLANRKENERELDDLISTWTRARDAGELAAELQRGGIAAGKSQSSLDLVSDPQLWARGFFREVADGDGRTRNIVGPSWKMSREATISSAAPRLGEHNSYVLGEILGLSASEQQTLSDAGITR
jgi:crotonobetainyl-CoA:carnitine CoA-transferase CaiB-like acyl-CoA transferase